MADDFEIVSRIVVHDASDAGVDGASRKLRKVEGLGERVGDSITRHLGRAFALIGGSYALQRLTGNLVGLHSGIEQATFGVSGLIQSLTGMAAADSLAAARGQVALLRRDAAVGAGEFADYTEAFQLMFAPVRQAGGGFEDVRTLTRQALGVGQLLRGEVGLKTAGLDVQQALVQGAGDRTTPIVAQTLAAIGLTSEAFNRLNPEKRLEKLSEAFGAFGPAVDLMGKSWSAQMATLRDNVKGLIEDVTRPLFDRWKGQLEGVNDWLAANRDTVREIATEWGPRILGVYDAIIGRGREVAAVSTGLAAVRIGAALGVGGLGPLAAVMAGVGGAAYLLLSAWARYPATLDRTEAAAERLTDRMLGLESSMDQLFASPVWAELGRLLNDWLVVPTLDALADMAGGATMLALGVQAALQIVRGAYIDTLALLRGDVSPSEWRQSVRGRNSGILDDLGRREFMLIPLVDAGQQGLNRGDDRRGGNLHLDPKASNGLRGPIPGESNGPALSSGNVYINKVEVKVEADNLDDPARVAFTFEDVLSRAIRSPRSPLRDPLPAR